MLVVFMEKVACMDFFYEIERENMLRIGFNFFVKIIKTHTLMATAISRC